MYSILFALSYPLEPAQIMLISLFTLGVPSFLLALEESKSRIEGKFMFHVMGKAIPGGLTDMMAVGALVVSAVSLHLNKTDIFTAFKMLLTAVDFLVLYKICQLLNRFRGKIILFCVGGIVLSGIFAHKLFSISAISVVSILLLIILFFVAGSIFRQQSQLIEKCSRLKNRKKTHFLEWLRDFFRFKFDESNEWTQVRENEKRGTKVFIAFVPRFKHE